MHKTNQPQINSEKLAQDASVQIMDKYEAILKGIDNKVKNQNPLRADFQVWRAARSELAYIIAGLTSQDKTSREHAKQEVRELVKLSIAVDALKATE